MFAILLRRRTLLILPVAIFILFLYSVQRPGSLSNNPISREKLFGSYPKVDEIYGLIHLVVDGGDEHHDIIDKAVESGRPIPLSVYADGKVIDWKNETQRLNTDFPIVIFGERYCPYIRRVQKILSAYDIVPTPYYVELDMRKDSSIIETILTRLTDRTMLPNILLRGKSIGGSDELLILHQSERLEQTLREAGVVITATGQENTLIP